LSFFIILYLFPNSYNFKIYKAISFIIFIEKERPIPKVVSRDWLAGGMGVVLGSPVGVLGSCGTWLTTS